MEYIEKTLSHTIDTVENLFKEKYYEANFYHQSVDKAVVKTAHDENGFHFEFAKMILTSQIDAHTLFDKDDETIQLSDFNNIIYFKIKDCKQFKFSVGFSGYTSIQGYINDFTTNHIVELNNSFYRAVLITKEKFNISSYLISSKALKVNGITYGSGIIEIVVNKMSLQLYGYDDKVTKRNYFIIETKYKYKYAEFRDIIDEIILGITYMTGTFLGRGIYLIGSNVSSFENNKLLCLKTCFADLKDGYAAVPEFRIQQDVGCVDSVINPQQFSRLFEELTKNLVYKRTLLLLCQAHSQPHYVKATLYSVALETITNLIFEQIEIKNKPIKNKVIAKKIRTDLKNVLNQFKTDISDEAFRKIDGDIERLNSLTNKQKLLIPFIHYKYSLPEKDIEAIEHRNDFLHGRMPNNSDKHYLAITIGRLLFCINLLVLKYIDFNGYIFYPAALYQYNNKLYTEEMILRKI